MIRDWAMVRETLLHVALARCQDIDRAIELATRMVRLVEHGPNTLQGEVVRVIDTVHGSGEPIEVKLLPVSDAGITAGVGAVAKPLIPAPLTDLQRQVLETIIAMQGDSGRLTSGRVAARMERGMQATGHIMRQLQKFGYLLREGMAQKIRYTVLRNPDGSDFQPPPNSGGDSRGGARPPSKPSHPVVDGAERDAADVKPSRPRPVTAEPGIDAAREVGAHNNTHKSGQKSDAELIAEAVAAGRVTKCQPGFAHGTDSTEMERRFGSRMPRGDFVYGNPESIKAQQMRQKRGARRRQKFGK